MSMYQIPGGFQSFASVEKIFADNLPQGFKVEKTKQPKGCLGEIYIRQNGYNGAVVRVVETGAPKSGSMGVAPYVPSQIIWFLDQKILGYLTRLVLPAIYGSRKKMMDSLNEVIMKNFEADKYDTSISSSLSSMFQGKPLKIKESSVKPQ